MTASELYEMMKKVQEPKGYFLNKDKDWVLSILADLLVNKERYGYMSCPCRLASSSREKDADIICPCQYRPEDVKNTAVVTVIYMFLLNGMKGKSNTSTFRKEDPREKLASKILLLITFLYFAVQHNINIFIFLLDFLK
jgi:ferredoxin-thioredoxin reductase catalytic subunit